MMFLASWVGGVINDLLKSRLMMLTTLTIYDSLSNYFEDIICASQENTADQKLVIL